MIEDIVEAGLVVGAAAGYPIPIGASSNVESATYSPSTLQLQVIYKGGRSYVYEGVDPVTVAAFVAASSKGSFANSTLRSFSFHRGEISISADTGAALANLAEAPFDLAFAAQTRAQPSQEKRAEQTQPGPWTTVTE